MKFKELLKKIFPRRNDYTTTISNFSDLIIVPTREDFKDSQDIIKTIDSFKKTYSRILASKRLITSKDLELESNHEDIKMYIELLLNLISDDEMSIAFEKVSYYNDGTKKIEHMCKMGKLKAYFYNIEKLHLETILHIIALKEIIEEKFFLSPIKKNSIKEEINNLTGALIIIENQRHAISIEISRYLAEYEQLKDEEFVSPEISQLIISQKCQELRSMLSLLIPDTLKNLNNTDNITNLVLMEKTLEEYIYKHPKKAQELSKKLANLVHFIKEDLELRNITQQIPELELKLKAFTLFGRNLINKEELYNFYNIKFATLTRNMMTNPDFSIVEEATHLEIECYLDIIFKKISAILTDGNSKFRNYFPNTDSKAVQNLSTILKNNTTEFDFWKILNNKNLLGLLVAFDKPNGLEEYFDNIYAKKSDYPQVNFHENTYKHSTRVRVRTDEIPFFETRVNVYEKKFFEFDLELPLTTIFSMIYYNEEEYENPLYDLFKEMLTVIEKKSDTFKLPKGLISINIPKKESELSSSDSAIISKIQALASDKNFETPSTLTEINGPLLRNIFLSDVSLNEGLRKISNSTFESLNAEVIYIPSSLIDVDETVFNKASTCEIYFADYSQLQSTEDSFINVIKHFFIANKTGDKKYHYVSDYVKEKQRAYHEGRYSTFVDMDLFDRDSVYQDYVLKLDNCSRIIFQKDDIPVFYFDENNLTLRSTRDITYDNDTRYDSFSRKNKRKNTSITYEEARKIYYHIVDTIKKELEKQSEIKQKKKTADEN